VKLRYSVIALLAGLAAAPAIAEEQSPKDLVAQIYRISAGPKGDYHAPSGFEDKQIRKHFTKSLLAAQKAMDQRSKKLNEPILDFDPVTNSQDPSVLHLSIDVESADAANTIVAASFDGESDPKRNLVRYIFVREDGAWRLDDMRGEAGDDKWNLRDVMNPKTK
jgi:Protein of unknown function (DUF3828)